MGKGQKQRQAAPWMAFLKGGALALGVYLAGLLFLALLLVRGTLPEGSAFPVVAALCVLAVFCGGLTAARQSPWGTLSAGLLCAALFAAVLAAVGTAFWQGITWTGHGGALLLCALAGGVLAGLLGGRRKKRRKRK